MSKHDPKVSSHLAFSPRSRLYLHLCLLHYFPTSFQMFSINTSPPSTIVASLPVSDGTTTGRYLRLLDTPAASQVKLLAVSNTFARILVGPLADFVSPVASYPPSGIVFPRKHWISRFAFLSVPSILLIFTCFWMAFAVRTQAQLWIVR